MEKSFTQIIRFTAARILKKRTASHNLQNKIIALASDSMVKIYVLCVYHDYIYILITAWHNIWCWYIDHFSLSVLEDRLPLIPELASTWCFYSEPWSPFRSRWPINRYYYGALLVPFRNGPTSRVTLYTAGHLHTAVPHCSHSRAPIVHTAVPRENNEHGCVYLRCRAVCKLPGCVEGHPWYLQTDVVFVWDQFPL